MKKVKTIEGKPLKRIEGKVHSKSGKLRLRLSRTGGLNAAIHPVQGLTFNTKHGARVSKTFKGLTLGIQGGRGVLRGRWSAAGGALNTNLSKSGLSFSTSTKHGTYNWTRPNRSSFKFAGIQVRGKKAAGPALILAIFAIVPALITLVFQVLRMTSYVIILLMKLAIWLLQVLLGVVLVLWNITLFFIWDLPLQILNLTLGRTVIDLSADDDKDADPQSRSSAPDSVSNEIGEANNLVASDISKLEMKIKSLTSDEQSSGLLRIIGRWLALVAGVSCGAITLVTTLMGIGLSLEQGIANAGFLFFFITTLLFGGLSYVLIRLGFKQVRLHRAQRKLALLRRFKIDKTPSTK